MSMHHVHTQAAGGLKVCGYYSKFLATREGRHCYFPAISLGSGNCCLLIPGLTNPSGKILTGDQSTALLKGQRSLCIYSHRRTPGIWCSGEQCPPIHQHTRTSTLAALP